MANSPNIGLALIEQSQSQKEVTVNESLLKIDALLNTSVISISTMSPPLNPMMGDLYIIPPVSLEEWAGKHSKLAYYDGSAWNFITPKKGASFFVADEEIFYFYDGIIWQEQAIIAQTTGEFWRAKRKEINLSSLSGEAVSASGFIPNRSQVFAIHARVIAPITGTNSFSIGVIGEPNKYGSGIGTALNSTNIGVATPQAFFGDSDIVLTATGGSFTGGEVNIVMHYMEYRGSWDW